MKPVLPRVTEALARASLRWVPDSLSIVLLLTLVTFALALTVGGASAGDALRAWGSGLWSLLEFSMQMVVVIFAGYVVAVSPAVTRLLEAAAGVPRTPRQAVAFTAALSMALCWLNWGVGLIVAAMLVRAVGRRRPDADYRLLVASAYLGMGTTWHGGPSGSVPLLLATPASFMVKDGLIAAPIPLAQTVFTPGNLALMAVVLVAFSLLAAGLHPAPERTLAAPRAALDALAPFVPPSRPAAPTPAERLLHSGALSRLIGAAGLGYLALQAQKGALTLTLDTVNLLFFCLGLLLHPSVASVLRAAEEASRSLHGVVLQFPLYAGLYGLLKGTALAGMAAKAFVAVASGATYPLVVFWYSAALNYVVPSGGGKWALEALYVLQAGRTLGVPPAAASMAYAYGDMATNLVQPFWAIPLLGVARLEFRDIFGHELLFFAAYFALVSGVLLAGLV
ncbi:MAG: short-chain fatty acid transporter [Betaproteobacteria bacterium]